MSDSQTLGGCWLPASCFRLSVSGFPSTVARHYGVRIMCRLCSYFSPAQKSSAGLLPFKGRGPWLFVTQHGRHKSKSRNADFIIIAAERQSTTLNPLGLSSPERSEHNPPPAGGHNPRGEAPSTFPSEPSEPSEPYEPSHRRCVQGRYHNLRAAGPSNLRTLRTLKPPLVPTAPPSRPAGKRVTGFSVAYGSLRIQFPCHRKRGDKKLQGTR